MLLSLVEIARECFKKGEFETAVSHLQQAQTYPINLGEGKLYGAQENNIFYYLGCAHEGLGDKAQAQTWHARAAAGLSEPTSAMFYNDQPPDMIFYQGMARLKLGQIAEAHAIFQKLIDYGKAHLNDAVEIDYFAISLPNFRVFEEDLNQLNQIHCHYMIALGFTGLKENTAAMAHYDAVLQMDVSHLDVILHRHLVDEG